MSERNSASELAGRIKASLIDPAKVDEARRPAEDRPPAYADFLMSEKPASVGKAVDLAPADWHLIATALEHYAGCAGE